MLRFFGNCISHRLPRETPRIVALNLLRHPEAPRAVALNDPEFHQRSRSDLISDCSDLVWGASNLVLQSFLQPPLRLLSRFTPNSAMGKANLCWTDEMDGKLNEILMMLADGGLRGSQIKTHVYNSIAMQLMGSIKMADGVVITGEHVKTHVKHKKKKFFLFRDAIRSSGFGIEWDSTRKCITADPISWRDYCEGKDDALKNMRGKMFNLYDSFYALFGDENSTGAQDACNELAFK